MLESQALLSPEAAAAERVEFGTAYVNRCRHICIKKRCFTVGEHYRAFRKSYPHIPLRDVAATADTDNSVCTVSSCATWKDSDCLCAEQCWGVSRPGVL